MIDSILNIVLIVLGYILSFDRIALLSVCCLVFVSSVTGRFQFLLLGNMFIRNCLLGIVQRNGTCK